MKTTLGTYRKVWVGTALAVLMWSPTGWIIPVHAEEGSTQTVQTVTRAESNPNSLTDTIQAAVKSASVESNTDGYQIAVTVRLYNSGLSKMRIPDYELHAVTDAGAEYKLDASEGNKSALKPMEIAELSYMIQVDSKEAIRLYGLDFVQVDEYTYPKVETTLLEIPIATEVWYGVGGSERQALNKLEFGQVFTIPGINSGIRYTPIDYSRQQSGQGTGAVVTLLVENSGAGRESIPDFRIDAISGNKSFTGQRTSRDEVQLGAGEKKYVHFSMPLDNQTAVDELLVVTTDTFQTIGKEAARVDVGRSSIQLPNKLQAGPVTAYERGTPIAIDPLYGISNHTDIALRELHLHQNAGDGYQTAIGKFVITNKSDQPVPVPAFDTELVGNGEAAYAGVRQANVSETVNPGLSYVVSYVFSLPETEAGSRLALRLLDSKAAAPYKVAIASLQTSTQMETDEDTFELYPYTIRIEDLTTGTNYVSTNQTFSYKLKLSLDIKKKENVVVDQSSSKLHFEVVDKLGRVLGTAHSSFAGSQKLVSGTQLIVTNNIQSEQFEFPISVNIFELIETPNGQGKRFLKTVK